MQLIEAKTLDEHFNVALVISRFNLEITHKLYEGALTRLRELGFEDARITVVWVPGAVEIPITAQRLAKTDKYEAIICLGAVIFGETRHFDYVCDQVSQGCQEVALSNDIPILFGVLTTEKIEQARERAGGTKGNIGRQTVDAAIELISVLRQIEDEL